MRTLFVVVSFALIYLVSQASSVSAMTSQELCARVFEQYGVRSETCDLDVAAAPTDRQEPLTDEIRESHVFFLKGGTTISDDVLLQMAVLVEVLEIPLMQNACLRLIGHSDSSGSAARNYELSLQRAELVAAQLRAGLSDDTRIQQVAAQGETHPLAGFAGDSRYNRRVEIQARSCN